MGDDPAWSAFVRDLNSLKVHRTAQGVSLKKPALLLVVLARLERGELTENRIRFRDLEVELSQLLRTLTGRPPKNLTEPFERMRTSSFWHLRIPEDTDASKVLHPRRVIVHDDCWASLPPEVFRRLSVSADARQAAVKAISERYLPNTSGDAVRIPGLRWSRAEVAGA